VVEKSRKARNKIRCLFSAVIANVLTGKDTSIDYNNSRGKSETTKKETVE
jgi:hypothetical protein